VHFFIFKEERLKYLLSIFKCAFRVEKTQIPTQRKSIVYENNSSMPFFKVIIYFTNIAKIETFFCKICYGCYLIFATKKV